MSSKFLNGFGEESSELRKQIGCMTGIFQMFDRHNLLGGRRLKNGHQNQKLPSGNSLAVDASNPASNNGGSPRLVIEKSLSKSLSENQRMSLESSRTSFSSSSCSSFSSVDCNKSMLQEPISFNQAMKDLPSIKNLEIDAKSAHQSLDFQRVVRDRAKREPYSLSKAMDGSYAIGIDGKSRSPLDINESFRVLMKLNETPWSFSDIMEPSLEPKQTAFNRRLSYDGREVLSSFLDSRENLRPSLSKLKELPRLSLDSRESSMRSCNTLLVKDLDKERSIIRSPKKELGSHNKSAPSVVAKLMGLEPMPSSSSTPMETMEKPNGFNVQKSNKPLNYSLHSKASMEPAPWKMKEKLHIPQNTISRRDNQLKQQQHETVYSEIEKRLNELEFRHANRDLRALKQILDAMQAKGLLESKKNGDQRSADPTRDSSNHQVSTTRSTIGRRPPLPSSTKRSNATKTHQSPIVIMKTAKSLDVFDGSTTSVIPLHGLTRLPVLRTNEAMDRKKPPPGSSKVARDSTQRSSPRINGKTEENGRRRIDELGSSKLQESSCSVSPRLQQRNTEVERRMHSSVSSSDSSKHQKLSANKQPSESVSPRNKLRLQSNRAQGNDVKESKESRNLSRQGDDEIFHRSDISISSPSKLDTGTDFSSTKQINSPVGPEQPSPVSVLDAAFYQDDLSAEMMRSPNNSKGIKYLPNSDSSCEPHHISLSEISQKKLASIGNLLQKLEELNSAGESASTTDHIASLCKTQSQDHRYISEILLASGLLMKDLTSAPLGLMPIQLHPSGHPINPDLFLVLEQTKPKQVSNFDAEKLHRKLLFDVVNEVLVQKLEVKCSSSHTTLQGSIPSGQQLLEELCSEIDRIHAEPSKAEDSDDGSYITGEKLLCQSLKWNDFRTGLPAIVLDIERAIFKDLIDEIVNGEAPGPRQKCERRRRKLFVK